MPQRFLPSRLPLLARAVRRLLPVLTGLAVAGAAQAASLTVTSNGDAGPGTLRQTLADAPSGATITFSGPMTITLGSTLVIGSGLTVQGDLDGNGSPDVVISGNDAVRVLQVNTTEPVELNGLVITRGFTTGGGAGVYVHISGNATVRHSELSDNHDMGGGGGALFASTASVTLIDSLVTGNSSTTFGGGLRVVGGGSLTMSGSTITRNRTTGTGAHGGGIQAAGSLSIVNSTISGNSAQGASSLGGGLRITSGTSHITHTTIVGNAATQDGGGVSAEGDDTFTNVVVAGNTAGAGAAAASAGSALASGGTGSDVSGTMETAVHSHFGTSTAITTNQGSLDNQGTAGLLLGTLAAHSGSVPTHLPQAGSVLIDAAPCLAAIPTDQRGVARPRGAQCDIGAVEADLAPPAAPTGVSVTVGNGSATVVWDPVADSGSLPVTGYIVTGTPGGTCTAGPAETRCTVAGLSNGQSYTFTVQAISGAGTSLAATSGAVTPLAAGAAAIPTLSQWGVLLLSALLGALALLLQRRRGS